MQADFMISFHSMLASAAVRPASIEPLFASIHSGSAVPTLRFCRSASIASRPQAPTSSLMQPPGCRRIFDTGIKSNPREHRETAQYWPRITRAALALAIAIGLIPEVAQAQRRFRDSFDRAAEPSKKIAAVACSLIGAQWGESPLLPCHTTGHAGRHPAVRLALLLHASFRPRSRGDLFALRNHFSSIRM